MQQRFLSLFLRSEREIFRYVAVLVPNVTLKRRFDLEGAVRGQLPVLARAIEKQLNKI